MATEHTTERSAERLRTIPQLLEERPALRSTGKQPERWIRRLIYERRLPYRKVGGRVMVDLADADLFLEGEKVPAAS